MRPDLSGEYRLDRDASALSTNAAAFTTASLRIDHVEPRFHCTARFATVDDALEFTFERFSDGRVVAVGTNETSRCFWDNAVLVTEDRTDGPDASVMTWRYELTDGGLRATECIRGAGRDQDNMWEFTRV